jgi:hypothetical protein
MPFQYKNRKGRTYYLHEGQTKCGSRKFFFSQKAEGNLVENIPDGYEIHENPNAQVSLRKIQPKIITDSEKALIEMHIQRLARNTRYMVDVKGKVITIFESVQDVDLLEELFESISGSRSVDNSAILQRITSFLPVMRFILEEDAEREFRVERYSFLGSINDWIDLGDSDQLEALLKKYVKHLGKESFYQLM